MKLFMRCIVNMSGVVFKIDSGKAYDKVKWSFLQQALRMKDFSDKCHEWIQTFVAGRSVAIKVNDDIGHYFRTKKGLRQGDPLSLVLFNIVVDMFSTLIECAKHRVEGGLSILEYANDTVLFMDITMTRLIIRNFCFHPLSKCEVLRLTFIKMNCSAS